MKVYAICNADGSLARNQPFANQQEAENEINRMAECYAEMGKALNRPPIKGVFTIVQLDRVDYEIALEKMEDKLVKALNELDVDEYPTIEELQAWLNTLTNPENMPEIDTVLRRAGGYGLMWEVLYSAHERQDEPDFEIVDALQEACYRWDI